MIKDDLIFNWRDSESHIGFKIIAVLSVALIFTVFFGLVDVRIKPPLAPSLESASVLHFADDELGRAWGLMAEENEPFPGRLEISGVGGIPAMDATADSDGVSGWSDYQVKLLRFQRTDGSPAGALARKGVRYFPERVKIQPTDAGTSEHPARTRRKAILTPFDGRAMGWMPDEVPDFETPADGGDLLSASWRFMLRLRPDGSVSDCVSLSGGGDAGLNEATEWLEGLRFKSGDGERWLGLRVEFVNRNP